MLINAKARRRKEWRPRIDLALGVAVGPALRVVHGEDSSVAYSEFGMTRFVGGIRTGQFRMSFGNA